MHVAVLHAQNSPERHRHSVRCVHRRLGQWHTTMAAQRVDVGNVSSYLAAKDMWDPSKGACRKTPSVEPFLESPLVIYYVIDLLITITLPRQARDKHGENLNKRAFCADHRVLLGWITIPHGALTMPREITYDAVLNRLNFSPLLEQARLYAVRKRVFLRHLYQKTIIFAAANRLRVTLAHEDGGCGGMGAGG
eukprot:COSAG06_NODE_5197_length_3644_cov_25.138926_1_plen_192_part_10